MSQISNWPNIAADEASKWSGEKVKARNGDNRVVQNMQKLCHKYPLSYAAKIKVKERGCKTDY